MERTSVELGLLEDDEQAQLDYIWDMIPEEDRGDMTKDDILFVLDRMDDYLESQGLVQYDSKTGEVTYLDGDVDETEQLNYVLQAAKTEGRMLNSVQIQLVQDAELQYGIEQGWYEEE